MRKEPKLIIYTKEATLIIGTVLFIIMSTTTFVQVLARYVFKYPIPWTDELARYLFIWSMLLGSAVAVINKAHITITSFRDMVPEAFRSIINGISIFGTLAFSLVLVIEGYKFAIINISNYSPAMRISLSLPMISIPIGGVLMLLFSIRLLYNNFNRNNNPGISRKEVKY
ncbi:MAG: hypothetical protein VR72_01495 [Clostridiaceae bacterium BRH_c20a]|nr:MAG: hypothetical protein VR72_01495 [Clostridiaceae bacterium BRH_c20a]